jgi:hypothetical protein
MAFIAPLLLLGALAVAIPIAIHLFGRRRAKVVRFAALDFLFQSNRKTARRMQIKEKALLLVRAAACLAIPLALAKPYTSCNRSGPHVARGAQAAVLVIDDSFASGIASDGKNWLSKAASQAQNVLTQLGPEAEVAIVRASQGAESSAELTRDHLRLRDQLLAMEPSYRPADTRRALEAAGQLLAASGHAQKTVFLFSLLAKTGFGAGPSPWGSNGPTLSVVDVAQNDRSNWAISKLLIENDPLAGVRGVAVTAEVFNASAVAAKDIELSLRLGSDVVARGRLDIPANSHSSKRFLAVLPKGSRGVDVQVSLPSDSLAVDNVRSARASLLDDVRVVIVNGDPRTNRRDDEVFYLETALRPGDRVDSGATVRVITADDITAQVLGEADVVVLANVPALTAARAATLSAWVHAGGGLFVTLGNRTDAAAYNQTMRELLPQNLGDIVDTTWGASAEEKTARALHLEKFAVDHPAFESLSKTANELRDAQFSKIFLLGSSVQASADSTLTILAQYSNGAAAIVETAPSNNGSGRIALLTSTIDRDWNDLAIHPGYLPLMQQLVRHLARRQAQLDEGDHLVGATVTLPVAGISKLEVTSPSNATTVFDGDRIDGRNSIRFTKTEAPGQYRVRTIDAAGNSTDRDDLAFSVNLDSLGSDLLPAPAAMLPASGSGGGDQKATSQERVELWHAVAAIILLLLLAEGLILQQR